MGTLLVAAAALPYAVEILRQVPLQARFLAILPPETRRSLPPHPRHPWLAPFGSVRFFLALFRYVLRNTPDDPIEVAALKRKMRASIAPGGAVCRRAHHRRHRSLVGRLAPGLAALPVVT